MKCAGPLLKVVDSILYQLISNAFSLGFKADGAARLERDWNTNSIKRAKPWHLMDGAGPR